MIADQLRAMIIKVRENEPLTEQETKYLIEALEARAKMYDAANNKYKQNKDKIIQRQLNYYHTKFKNDQEKVKRKNTYNTIYKKRKKESNE